MPDAIKISRNILTINAQEPTLAIFDLDSTLYNVSYRTREILNTLSQEDFFKRRYPEKSKLIYNLAVQPSDWGFRDVVKRAQIEADLEFFEIIRNYWVKHFFSSDFLKYDRPYAGAVQYVKHLHQNGVEIKYLTGRDKINMHTGTVESLKEWAFPYDEQHLHMKPHSIRADEDYKLDEIKSFMNSYKKIWFFENEPVIINKVIKSGIDIELVFVDTVHSGKDEPPDSLPTIRGQFGE